MPHEHGIYPISFKPNAQVNDTIPGRNVRILFYNAGRKKHAWLYTTILSLKTYVDILYPTLSPYVTWCKPIQQVVDSSELIECIKTNQVDILCTGHFVWNHGLLMNQLSAVKKQLGEQIQIIVGGPNIDVYYNQHFFVHYPFVDYAVYGPGEQAFSDILNHLILQQPLTKASTSNCAWKDRTTGDTVVADYKFVKMLSTSPYLHCKELFSQMVKDLQQNNDIVWLTYINTRGCPYSCTFCDWNSGFDNKVSRRKNTWKEEIDLFHELNIKYINLADANFGQYEEDIAIMQYFGKKNQRENAGFRINGNFAKLKKDVVFQLWHIMIYTKLTTQFIMFAIQDINEKVLENIDRPDVGWEAHKAIATKLTQRHPGIVVRAQLIVGLPGQTVESWHQTLIEITEHNIIPEISINYPLPASPALLDPEYQNKFQFEYVRSNVVYFEQIESMVMPKQCFSFSSKDLVEMVMASSIYTLCAEIKLFCLVYFKQQIDIIPMIKDLLSSKYYQKSKAQLYENWTQHKNFYFYGPDNDITTQSAISAFSDRIFTQPKVWKKIVTKSLPSDLTKVLNSPPGIMAFKEFKETMELEF